MKILKNKILIFISIIILCVIYLLYQCNSKPKAYINGQYIGINESKVYLDGAVKNSGQYVFKNNQTLGDQTTPNMIQRISEIFERKPLISKEI